LSDWIESFVPASDGTKLYVRERPAQAPLTALLCDGIACDGFIWRYLVDDLAPLARIVHWNYRGHGRSAAPVDPERVGMASFVDDLNAVRRASASGPVVLFGHSMGCQLALEGYRSAPDDVAALVLFCGTAGRMTHTFKGSDALAKALPKLIERVEKSPRLTRALFSNVPPAMAARIALATGEVDAAAIAPEDIVAYSEHVASLDLGMFLRMLRAIGDETAEDLLPRIQVPALVIAGELDTFTPRHLAEQLAASMPHGELVVVKGATHVVPIERRDEVAAIVRDFLGKHVLSGS
jgi:pimeloyl-ACP methyl ester carboxylesterase